MAKITLGKPPETWKRTVTFSMLDGGEGAITCTFRYMTRRQFGEFVDKMAAAGQPADPGADFTMTAFQARTVDTNADYLAEILAGWDLDTRLSRDALVQLCDELPGAALAIMNAYRAGTLEGRLGN